MIFPAPNDIAFKIFGLSVYWYGILMAIAIFVAIMTANKLFNRINPQAKRDIILEQSPLIIIFGIICARLYFCLLNSHYYLSNPFEILNIRQGGLSVHGAILGGILSVIYISKKCKISFLSIMDSLSCSTILGQAIGRWGNYFNSEAYGLPVASQKWGVFIPQSHRVSEYANYNLFHPTFLYESVLDFLAFFVLLIILKKTGKNLKGITFFSYLLIYAIIRFFVEKIRVDSALNIGNLPFAELVSFILAFLGILGIAFIIYKNKKFFI